MKAFNRIFYFTLLTLASTQSYAASYNQTSFTPSSVVVPITEITLKNGDSNSSVIYTCSGTLADCGVNIADSAVLAALAQNASIDPGTYDRISVGTCRDEGSYQAAVTGSADLPGYGGVHYTTTPAIPGTDDVLSTNSADSGPVTVTYSGCSNDYFLRTPITIEEGDSVKVNLFVNLENIAWMRGSNSASIPSGCLNNSNGGNDNQVVCMAYPDVVAFIGSTTPTVQTYYVAVEGSSSFAGQFILLFHADGSPIGGFTRPYYHNGSPGDNAGFDTPFRTFSDNGDGTYTLGNYGSSAASYDRLITDFIPATTPGETVTGNHDALSPRTPIDTYSAVLQ